MPNKNRANVSFNAVVMGNKVSCALVFAAMLWEAF